MRHVTIVDGQTVFVDGNDEYNDPVRLMSMDTPKEVEEQEYLDRTEGSWSDPENHGAGELVNLLSAEPEHAG